MRRLRNVFLVSAVGAIAGLSALNWRAQLQTQQKLDALTAALAERPAEAAPPPVEALPPAKVQTVPPGTIPRELDKVTLPPYIVESPDILLIEAVVKDPKSGVAQPFLRQPLPGQFLVRPDGTVSLGTWGSVYVSGLTLDQAATAVRKQLAKFASAEMPADKLTIVVDVAAYNSKKYYVITDGVDSGEQVFNFSLTGNETVLDALGNIGGLPDVASERNIWIARSSPRPGQPWQKMPVDWVGMTQHGVTTTNYQLLPGDRVYVKRAAD